MSEVQYVRQESGQPDEEITRQPRSHATSTSVETNLGAGDPLHSVVDPLPGCVGSVVVETADGLGHFESIA